MMSWNHRVWQQNYGDETWYDIRETYYKDGEVVANDAESTAPRGETLDELRGCLVKMLDACEAAMLDGPEFLVADGFEYLEAVYD